MTHFPWSWEQIGIFSIACSIAAKWWNAKLLVSDLLCADLPPDLDKNDKFVLGISLHVLPAMTNPIGSDGFALLTVEMRKNSKS